jgi:DNA repair exonuclease SbcCD ATPase subunit
VIKSHSECTNPVNRISERDLEEITRRALKRTIDQQNEVCKTLEEVLTDSVVASQNKGNELSKLKHQKISRENQIDSLIDTLSEGGLSNAAKERIKSKINTITEEIDNLTEIIKDKESSKLSVSYVEDKIAEIKSAIAKLRNFTEMDRERILNYIERIKLPADGDVNMLLKSGQVIKIVATGNRDFSEGDSVVKNGKQDVRC